VREGILTALRQSVRHEFPLIKGAHFAGSWPEGPHDGGARLGSADILKDKGRYDLLGKAAAKNIPDCRLVEIPDVEYIPHLKAPDQFY
jgi:hypothetical protein